MYYMYNEIVKFRTHLSRYTDDVPKFAIGCDAISAAAVFQVIINYFSIMNHSKQKYMYKVLFFVITLYTLLHLY